MAHTYILGQSGTGKSTLLKQNILQSIKDNAGVFYLDPHGSDTDELLQYIPKSRRKDVILFDPSRKEVVAINPFEDADNIPLAVSILADAIKDAWGYADASTPTMDMYLYFSLAALAEAKEPLSTLPTLLTEKDIRLLVLNNVSDILVKTFWAHFDTLTPKEQRQEISSTLNKALLLIADNRVRRVFSSYKSSFSIQEVVNGKILFARLPQGQLSKGRVKILGSVLLSLMHQAALGRDTTKPFHFYLDECHLWAPSVVKEMLSGIRKFNVELTLTHQYIDQLDKDYFAAISGNVSDMIIFRTSMDDAAQLEKRFGPNRLSIEFDRQEDFTARQSPFTSQTPTVSVAPISEKIYPRSWLDIKENHRRSIWR